ncbi:hypothetical protein QTP88_003152 [Uroleucon formosanum]
MDPNEKADRWKEYFTELLNADIPDNSTRRKNIHGAESMVSEVTREEVNGAIKDLKNWKSPGSDEIPDELIKYSGKEMQNLLFRIYQKIWKNESIEISLFNSAYKVFAKILLKRLTPYAEENLRRYQCGFRKGKSTIEQLTIIGQLIEKKYEFRQNIWQLFVDFKKAYDKKVIRELQSETTGVEIGQQHIQVLGFSDDLNILGNSLEGTKKAAQALKQAASKIGLKINAEKTKVMKLLEDGDNPNAGSLTFEKVDEFRYLGAMLSAKNDLSKEIGVKIAKAESAAFALNKFFKSKLFSKKTKT